MAEETAPVRIRKSLLKGAKRAAIDADKPLTDWLSDLVEAELIRAAAPRSLSQVVAEIRRRQAKADAEGKPFVLVGKLAEDVRNLDVRNR